jgi:hypothetical protein
VLFLLVIPVLAAVDLGHRYFQIYAPMNMVSRKVRRSPPRFRAAAGLLILALALLSAMHGLAMASDVGAPTFLNLVVLLLAWDTIKIGVLALFVATRCLISAEEFALDVRRPCRPRSAARQPASHR